jgi:hypothetical protein
MATFTAQNKHSSTWTGSTKSIPVSSITTAATLPGTGTSVGFAIVNPWVNPSNITLNDGSFAEYFDFSSSSAQDSQVKLTVDAGTSGVGNNKAVATLYPSTFTSQIYGGSADVWGASLTPAIVNSSSFGVYLEIDNNLVASSFGFTIPTSATITGITVEINRRYVLATQKAEVDYMKMTVDYTVPVPTAWSPQSLPTANTLAAAGLHRGLGPFNYAGGEILSTTLGSTWTSTNKS